MLVVQLFFYKKDTALSEFNTLNTPDFEKISAPMRQLSDDVKSWQRYCSPERLNNGRSPVKARESPTWLLEQCTPGGNTYGFGEYAH
jgi:hypothetical protein